MNTTAIASYESSRQVRFVDTDASGFVHFSAYIRMMEETEYAFLRSRGLNVVLYDEKGTLGFPRIHASIEIIEPLVFEQDITVQLRLTDVDGKQVVYEFEICDTEETVCVKGQFKAACCRFPDQETPYAVLIPEYVMAALTSDPSIL